MRMTLVGSLVALEVMVTLLLIGPMRLVSYRTLIDEVAPGMMGVFSHFGTVHPHEPLHKAHQFHWIRMSMTMEPFHKEPMAVVNSRSPMMAQSR